MRLDGSASTATFSAADHQALTRPDRHGSRSSYPVERWIRTQTPGTPLSSASSSRYSTTLERRSNSSATQDDRSSRDLSDRTRDLSDRTRDFSDRTRDFNDRTRDVNGPSLRHLDDPRRVLSDRSKESNDRGRELSDRWFRTLPSSSRSRFSWTSPSTSTVPRAAVKRSVSQCDRCYDPGPQGSHVSRSNSCSFSPNASLKNVSRSNSYRNGPGASLRSVSRQNSLSTPERTTVSDVYTQSLDRNRRRSSNLHTQLSSSSNGKGPSCEIVNSKQLYSRQNSNRSRRSRISSSTSLVESNSLNRRNDPNNNEDLIEESDDSKEDEEDYSRTRTPKRQVSARSKKPEDKPDRSRCSAPSTSVARQLFPSEASQKCRDTSSGGSHNETSRPVPKKPSAPTTSQQSGGGSREVLLDFPPMPKSKPKKPSTPDATTPVSRTEKSSKQRQNNALRTHQGDNRAGPEHGASPAGPLKAAQSMPGLNDQAESPPARRPKSSDRGAFKKESKSCNFLYFFRRKKSRPDRSPSPESRENHKHSHQHRKHHHHHHHSRSQDNEASHSQDTPHRSDNHHRQHRSKNKPHSPHQHHHRSRERGDHSSRTPTSRDGHHRSSSKGDRAERQRANSSSFAELPVHPSFQQQTPPPRPPKPAAVAAEHSGRRRSPSPQPPPGGNGNTGRLYIPNATGGRARTDTTTTRDTGCDTQSSSPHVPAHTPVSRTQSDERFLKSDLPTHSPHATKRAIAKSVGAGEARKNSRASANANSTGLCGSNSNIFDSVAATSGSGLNFREKSFPADLDKSERSTSRQGRSKSDFGSRPELFGSQPDFSASKSERSASRNEFGSRSELSRKPVRSKSQPEVTTIADDDGGAGEEEEEEEGDSDHSTRHHQQQPQRPEWKRQSFHSASRTDVEVESQYPPTTVSSGELTRRSAEGHSRSMPSLGDRFQHIQNADRRVINDAEDFVCKPTPDMLRAPLNLSLCGCGFIGMYHLGVVTCLTQHGASLLDRVDKVGGASAGALMAAVLVTAPDRLEDSGEHIHALAKEIRRKPLGALTPGYSLTKSMRTMVEDILPDNAHHLARGKLWISLTNATTKKNEMLSDFKSKEELVEALVASSYIPVYAGMKLPIIRGQKYYDGGLSDNLPKFEHGRTVTVSPFDGKTDISPKQGQEAEKKAHFINMHNQDIQALDVFSSDQINLKNIKRGAHAFFPPRRGVLQDYFDKGRYDASRFLIKQGLYEINYQQQSKTVLYESSV